MEGFVFYHCAHTRLSRTRGCSQIVYGARSLSLHASESGDFGKFALLCKHAEVGHGYTAGNTDPISSGRQVREYDAEITVYW